MFIKNSQELINAQKRINTLQLILDDLKKTTTTKEEFQDMCKSLIQGMKNIEDDIYSYLMSYENH